MARIRSKNTKPEVLTRSAVQALGLRFRNHVDDLPGKPDLANKTRKWAIFVHGCFWHRHSGCIRTTTPKRNRLFWEDKFAQNQRRDTRVRTALHKLGFTTIVVWECQVENNESLVIRRFTRRLRPPAGQS